MCDEGKPTPAVLNVEITKGERDAVLVDYALKKVAVLNTSALCKARTICHHHGNDMASAVTVSFVFTDDVLEDSVLREPA